jgi:hypothetical protein
MTKMLSKEISSDTFQDYLMDKVDKQREFLTLEEFQEIEFPDFDIPSLLLEILSKVT